MLDLYFALFLAALFLGYGMLALRRRARYRSLASRLGARHVDAGWFRPGTIAGTDFELEAVQVGKTYRTRMLVAAGDTPGPFLLGREFFGDAPNWSHAKVSGTHNERVFLWQVTVGGYVEPSREQRESLLRWLPPDALSADTPAALAAAKIREVVIADGAVSTRFSGILSNPARIQLALEALRRLTPGEASSRAVRAA